MTSRPPIELAEDTGADANANIRADAGPTGHAVRPDRAREELSGDGARTHPSDGARGSVGSNTLTSPDIRMAGRRIMLAPHNCFACGQLNTHGLRIDLHVDRGRCWTELALAERFEGWEGIVHGGILCTLLDEVMAWALIDHDSWGVTARMSVEFKRPVRVGVPIRAEGWITRARRRLLETGGRIVDARTDEELATATGVYVAATEEKKRELKARYRFVVDADEQVSIAGGPGAAAEPSARDPDESTPGTDDEAASRHRIPSTQRLVAPHGASADEGAHQ